MYAHVNLSRLCTRVSLRASMATLCCSNYGNIVSYKPPAWCSSISEKAPKSRLILSQMKTPIVPWNVPDLPDGFKLYIKRDDMTGGTLMGNKVRKLEFLLADAKLQGADAVITCGGIQSNHCRATAIAAREVGLKTYLLLRSNSEDPDESRLEGNLLLDLLVDATVVLVPKRAGYVSQLMPRMQHVVDELKEKKLMNVYQIPLGGSNGVGTWGYVEAYREMMEQEVFSQISDVVVPCGSGGTSCGLGLASYLSGSTVRVHGVSVCDDQLYFHTHCNEILNEMGVTGVRSEDILDVVDGYKGIGYGESTDEELQLLTNIGRKTGILLDPTYTLKAVRGMLIEMKTNPSRFSGRNVMFIHTGGLYGMLDGRLDDVMRKQVTDSRQIISYFSTDRPPHL